MGLEGLSRCDTAIFTPIPSASSGQALAFRRRGGRDCEVTEGMGGMGFWSRLGLWGGGAKRVGLCYAVFGSLYPRRERLAT